MGIEPPTSFSHTLYTTDQATVLATMRLIFTWWENIVEKRKIAVYPLFLSNFFYILYHLEVVKRQGCMYKPSQHNEDIRCPFKPFENIVEKGAALSLFLTRLSIPWSPARVAQW